MEIPVKILSHYNLAFGLPKFQTPGAAGVDLFAALGDVDKIIVKAWSRILIPTGLCIQVPQGFEAQIRMRSSLALKTNLFIPNAPGTIDSDYRGEIKIIMGNLGPHDIEIFNGDRIAQLVISQINQFYWKQVNELDETMRMSGGFGSTGLSIDLSAKNTN